MLAVDGAVQRVSGGWRSTGQEWVYDADRYKRVALTRTAEQQSMIAYVRPADSPKATCRMAFLQHSPDDPTAAPCGRCDVCAGPWYPTEIPARAAEAAAARLDRPGVELDTRAQWPTGVDRLAVEVHGKITADEALNSGRAVARLTDLGWGQRLRTLLGDDGLGHEASALAGLEAPGSRRIRTPPTTRRPRAGGCSSSPRPWSRRASQRRVAARLRAGAGCLGLGTAPGRDRLDSLSASAATRRGGRGIGLLGRLPYLGELDLAHGGPTGQPGGNSAFRLAAVWERFVVGPAPAKAIADLGDQPILLVDDLADSRWTMTVAGRELRRAGAVAVLPFALALTA